MTDYQFLSQTVLFKGIETSQIPHLLPCLKAHTQAFAKDTTIYMAGQPVTHMGLVLSGSVHIELNDYWGNKTIFAHITAGDIFAETYTALPKQNLLIDVVAAQPTNILFLNTQQIMQTCQHACIFHRKLIQNLLQISAQKNIHMSMRMMHIASKSIRSRLISYLSAQATLHASSKFQISFTRQQLADYLGVERSALSNELSKMQKDGLILYQKNNFTLLTDIQNSTN